MRTTLNLSDKMIREAIVASGKQNKTELINTALKEYIRMLKRKKLMSLKGSGIINSDFDVLKDRKSENEEW